MKTAKILCLLLLIVCVSCKQSRTREFVRSVKIVSPVGRGTSAERSLPGIVKENQIINLGFKAQGEISNIYVKTGDYVRQGQILAKLDDKDYRLQLSATEIQYDQLKAEVGRLEELYRRNTISGNDYEKAVAGLRAMDVQRQGYRNQVEYTTLKAPASGYIQSVNFHVGEMIDAGRPVFTLMDTGSLVVESDLPAELYLQRDNFRDIVCRTNILPGGEFPLNVLSINRKSNGSQLYKMQLTIADPSGSRLSAGMNVQVYITVDNENATSSGNTLPVQAVFADGGRHYVWVLSQDSTVSRKEVIIQGLDGAGSIVVTGVSPEDDVVSAGVQYLQEGERVNVISVSETNVGGLL